MTINDFCGFIHDKKIAICVVDDFEGKWIGIFPQDNIPKEIESYEVKGFEPRRCNSTDPQCELMLVVFIRR